MDAKRVLLAVKGCNGIGFKGRHNLIDAIKPSYRVDVVSIEAHGGCNTQIHG